MILLRVVLRKTQSPKGNRGLDKSLHIPKGKSNSLGSELIDKTRGISLAELNIATLQLERHTHFDTNQCYMYSQAGVRGRTL